MSDVHYKKHVVFRETEDVIFYDITVEESNASDLVVHTGSAVSPPNDFSYSLKKIFAYVVFPLPYVPYSKSVFLPFVGKSMLCCRISTNNSFVSALEKTISAVDEGVKLSITLPPSIHRHTYSAF